MAKVIGVKFKNTAKVYYFAPIEGQDYQEKSGVVVETAKGLEYGTVVFGILTLALSGCKANVWIRSKIKISLALGVLSVLLFMISLQPYAAVFAFSLLIIKVVLLLKFTKA